MFLPRQTDLLAKLFGFRLLLHLRISLLRITHCVLHRRSDFFLHHSAFQPRFFTRIILCASQRYSTFSSSQTRTICIIERLFLHINAVPHLDRIHFFALCLSSSACVRSFLLSNRGHIPRLSPTHPTNQFSIYYLHNIFTLPFSTKTILITSTTQKSILPLYRLSTVLFQ